ncbi:thymidylate synthase [Vibrio vulnificus]|uniref:thymidylate synthase n=1 Tax=Vibrio TaxID=662 RepID=UPI00102A9BD6|nr:MULTISPECIES: thymidylate synthase [Vibrio]EHH1226751.1 thymidylate synthase [Vibrio vulnificus]EJB8415877.1 thymidylate synthase [Vibrio vulnificus]ELX4133051.1 thymidylate synthase [Vibrio vulnificus]ELX4178100.1 thymidylate synthase [Vibrio vulnificus]MCG9749138.1 thymidylate synthase [Vibrio brasiliensis]
MKEYLELLEDVYKNGAQKGDRTGTGTRAVFGRMYRVDLAKGFPLLTTKKVFFKGVVNELLWFLSGSTNINDLDARIWDEWALEDGELGPVYGKQWTGWECKDGRTINQIDYVVDLLKNNPNSRRILFHGWNVEYLPDEKLSPHENARNGRMALPPCHLLYQFQVIDNKLNLMLTIRSNDMFLGHPFNLAQAALWVHILAQQCELEVGELIMSIGDAHIYNNHIEQVEEQLSRTPTKLPTLNLKRKPLSVYDYKLEDFELVGYEPQSTIKATVAV